MLASIRPNILKLQKSAFTKSGCSNGSLLAVALIAMIKNITDKCYFYCCHNSYRSCADFIVDDVEKNYPQLALGASQVQLLCLHAVVGEGNFF